MTTKICPFTIKVSESLIAGPGQPPGPRVTGSPCVGDACMLHRTVVDDAGKPLAGTCSLKLQVDMQQAQAQMFSMVLQNMLVAPEGTTEEAPKSCCGTCQTKGESK